MRNIISAKRKHAMLKKQTKTKETVVKTIYMGDWAKILNAVKPQKKLSTARCSVLNSFSALPPNECDAFASFPSCYMVSV